MPTLKKEEGFPVTTQEGDSALHNSSYGLIAKGLNGHALGRTIGSETTISMIVS